LDDSEYDGIFFTPAEEDGSLKIEYFTLNDEYRGKPIESTVVGHKYYIAFFKVVEEGMVTFDENFEAIFADPTVYVESLAGHNLYGAVVRKTAKSGKFWENYLTTVKKLDTMTPNVKST
jgi:hypothetical protein